ncbi:MAG TPA: hypothetical protein VFH44_11735 [Solirubrobacterales bacterium]|nr:hypothetical protein [Solirubrobacterales bacterium]
MDGDLVRNRGMGRFTLAFTVAAFALVAVAPTAAFALDKPPQPRVVAADGAYERAARGSYCWGGRHFAICADTSDPMIYAPTLRVPVGTSQVVRMRHEVTSLAAYNRRGNRFQLQPLGDGGRRFRLTIDHRSAPHPTAVYLSADYGARGDGLFAIKIRPRN